MELTPDEYELVMDSLCDYMHRSPHLMVEIYELLNKMEVQHGQSEPKPL